MSTDPDLAYWLGYDPEEGWFIAEPNNSQLPDMAWRNRATIDPEAVTDRHLDQGPITRDQYLELWLNDWPNPQEHQS